MALPSPRPAQFGASLSVSVRAVIAHPILRGGRQRVDAGPLRARAEVDRQAGTLRIVEFPTVSDRVATMIGKVSASVEIQGQPAGSFDDSTGHVSVETELHIAPQTMLARDSDVTMVLSSTGRVETPEVTSDGDPLDDGDETLRLVGQGTFRGGTLSGGTFWLVLDCTVDEIDAQTPGS